MSEKMRRRRRQDRRKRVMAHRRELSLFFGRGIFPASAQSCAMCPCGARAFSLDASDDLSEFMDAHAYCDVEAY